MFNQKEINKHFNNKKNKLYFINTWNICKMKIILTLYKNQKVFYILFNKWLSNKKLELINSLII